LTQECKLRIQNVLIFFHLVIEKDNIVFDDIKAKAEGYDRDLQKDQLTSSQLIGKKYGTRG